MTPPTPPAVAAHGVERPRPVAGSPIPHVIVVIQENRTTDNLFASSVLTASGGRIPARTSRTIAHIDGKTIAFKAVPFEYPADPRHTHARWSPSGTTGRWTASRRIRSSPIPAYRPGRRTFRSRTFPPTKRRSTTCSRSATRSPTKTLRRVSSRRFRATCILVTAQSQPADDPNDPLTWGCDSKPGTTVPVFGSGEAETTPGVFPCFDNLTIGDLLDRAGVSWKYYTGAYDAVADAWVNVYDAIRHIRYGPDWQQRRIADVERAERHPALPASASRRT